MLLKTHSLNFRLWSLSEAKLFYVIYLVTYMTRELVLLTFLCIVPKSGERMLNLE